jgi:hypothetical protein
MNRRFLRCVLLAAVGCLLPVTAAHGYLTDTASHAPSAYDSFVPPAKNQTYTDAVFGTQIRRLSNSLVTPNAADGGALTYVMDEYSTVSAFNQDRSLLLLQHDSYFGLYDGQGGYLGDLPFAVHAGSQPRWSRTDPHVLYFLNDNRVRKIDVLSGAITTLRTFSEYGSISGNGESDICFDGNHLVLAGDGRYIFVYDIASNTKGAVFDTGGRGFDSLYISADDQVTITWYEAGTARYQGIELFNENMVFQRQVARAGGHMDMARDTNGAAVLVWTNSADPNPVCDNGVVKVRLSDGQQTCLQSLDWNLAIHVSCADQGSCIVGTYAPGDPAPSGSWPAYTNEIYQVPLDGSEIRRLAHHRSRPHNGYNYTPRATVSRDGARVVYSSNYSLQAIDGAPTEYSDAYLLSAPDAPAGGGGGGGGGGSDDGGGGTGGGGGGGGGTVGGGTTSGVAKIQESDPAVIKLGTWHPNSMAGHSGGAALLAMDQGSRIKVPFTGTGIRWIGYRDEWSGFAKVYVDGVFVKKVNTYASPAKAQATLFSVTGLAPGKHTLKIVVTGTHSAASAGSWVWADAFEILSGSSGQSGGSTSSGTTADCTRCVSLSPTGQ